MSNNKKCVHGELLVASSHKLGLLVTLNQLNANYYCNNLVRSLLLILVLYILSIHLF